MPPRDCTRADTPAPLPSSPDAAPGAPAAAPAARPRAGLADTAAAQPPAVAVPTAGPAQPLTPFTALMLIVGCFSLQSLSTDFYAPAMPGLARRFGVAIGQVQLTLSVFIAGFGIGQLLFGPVSDRYGRKPVLIGGAGLYAAASVACALAPNIGLLVAGRLLQAIGACAAIVGSRAIVRDLHAPAEGARVLAQANGILTLALLGAPVLGGALGAWLGFRAIFVVLAAVALALLAALLRYMHETAQPNHDALKPGPMLAIYRDIATHRAFWAYTVTLTTSYCGLFAFIAGASFVFADVLHLSATAFGLCFALAILGYVFGTLACRRWIGPLGIRRTMMRAGLIQCAAGVAMVALAVGGVRHAAAFVLPQFFFNFAHGIATPCCQAGASAPFPRSAGAAGSLVGCVQMSGAALMALWMGASYDGTVYPLALTVGAMGLGTLAATRLLVARWGRVAPA